MTNLRNFFRFLPLVVIHTLDMELTNNYIGNDCTNEAFPPMRFCIRIFGISTALWISRIVVYLYIYLAMMFRDNQWWRSNLIVFTTVYYASMSSWCFTLGIIDWDVVVNELKALIHLHTE